MKDTRLSVILTNYNHEKFLNKRIASILEQLIENDELIIIDDCSKDHSVTIIENFLPQDPRIIFLKNMKNLGAIKSANLGVKCSKGRYLTWLASDDFLLPGFIEKTVQLLEKTPEIAVCCSNFVMSHCLEDYNEKKVVSYMQFACNEPKIFKKDEICKIFWNTSFWIPGHTAIVRKKFVPDDGYEEKFGHLCDWFLVHSIALNEGAAFIPENLAIWRQDEKSYSMQIISNKVLNKKYQKNILDFLGQPANRHLKKLFLKSGLMHSIIKNNLGCLFFRLKYFDYIFRFSLKFLKNKIMNFNKVSNF